MSPGDSPYPRSTTVSFRSDPGAFSHSESAFRFEIRYFASSLLRGLV